MLRTSFLRVLLSVFALGVFITACSKKDDNVVWVYTSVYPETLQKFEDALKKKHPDITVKWFQNGSENINTKLAMEQKAGNIVADIVLTADVFWFRRMAKEGFFEPYLPKLDYQLPTEMTGKDGAYSSPRISIMAIGYNKKFLSAEEAPKSFQELADPKWKGKISSGSPLESGTNYAMYINLAYKYGYEFLEKLHDNDVMAAGGNSAVMKRLVTGERPVGVAVLESLLNDGRKNPDIGVIYPSDGIIVIPGPMALVKKDGNRDAAKKVYDFFLSPEGQAINRDSLVYVPDPKAGVPEGAKAFTELQPNLFDLSDKFFEFVEKEEAGFKDKFADIMFE